MELAELVTAMRVVELTAKTRQPSIRALAQATNLEEDGIDLDVLLEAIEDREATAQTIVDEGFAMPHAIIDWDGEFRVVLGRSRTGIEYGVAESGRVHLIALFVVGRHKQKAFHLELLAGLAQLLKSQEFRQQLIGAADTRALSLLLRTKVGIHAEKRPRRAPTIPRINTILVRQAIELIELVSGQAILITIDCIGSVPWDAFTEWDGRLLIITSQMNEDVAIDRPNTHFFKVPHTTLTRMDRANLGLLLAAAQNLLTKDTEVVCISGPGSRQLDSLTVTKPDTQLEAMFGTKGTRRSANIQEGVILRGLSLAIELAEEGREGKPVGTMFVIGDTPHVQRHTQQLVLNPFHGYTRSLRNLLDPSLAETIKEFAQLDGAFIVQADGMVLSAGTYLIPKLSSGRLSSGLGTRHQAAAAITGQTQAMSIVISQSTGTVTVFRHGQIVLKLERATPTRS